MSIGKLIGTFVAGCVGFGSPLVFSFSNLTKAQDFKENRMKNVILADVTEGGGSLSVNLEKLFQNKEENKSLTFEEVGMKFGETALGKDDLLVSPCQDGKYYYAKYLSLYRYKLGQEEIYGRFNCNPKKFQNLTHVKLDWTKPKHVFGSKAYLSKIAVGSCTFRKQEVKNIGKQNLDWKIIVNCSDFLGRNGTKITGTF